MKSPRITAFAPTALMLGNLVIGMSVLAPTGMLLELSSDLGVSVRDAGLLITYGAIILCIGSPLTAWLTSRIDRRVLLGITLAALTLTNAVSAVAPSYGALLATRLIMLAVGVIYTPQAAGTIALLVGPERRGSGVAYVFIGWSLATAIGLPAIALIAHHFGWRAAFGAIAAFSAFSTVFLIMRLPRGLYAAPVDLSTWVALLRNPLVIVLLTITAVQICGQFVLLAYLGPVLAALAGATATQVAIVFACYGIAGLAGGIIATSLVDRLGPFRTSIMFTSILLIGLLWCALSVNYVVLTAIGAFIWGAGFAPTNSMQQVRLVGAAPPLAGASVSLNTSTLYLGQAAGSAIGGFLFASGQLDAMGFVATAFIAVAVALVLVSSKVAQR